ncbi:unnamed protein product [Thlaspi arvense]|uniref:TF-B3 domain-containing protein n=1 Tax=Thlaspi arvense TaxID=13288 RepID=A0AAU9SA50_THLAR|nr:unnamed protein product [Thlaspi arvense]
MAKSTLLHPQFFHTLVHGFHTHLMIPLEFFSKYIEGKTLGKTTAELKSDSSEVTWKVKMTGRRLSEGWEEFAVAYNFQTGDVLLVRYEGDMIFHVSDLGPSCCEIQDNPPPRNDIYGQFDVGKTLLKKRLYPRTQVDFSPNDGDGCDDEDDMEPPRKKKVKKNSPEAETASSSDNSYEKNNPEAQAVSSSSSDNSCFVAVVTPSSLRTDTLYLPQHVTSSSGFTRKCRKIVLIDGGERSWALDLRFKFNKSSDTFYISRGWRRFCEENGQEAGGFFMFKLVGNGETPVLSFDPTKTYNKTRQRECSEASRRESLSTEVSSEEENVEGESGEEACISMESLVEIEKTKCSPKRRVQSYSSYLPSHKRFVTFTLPPDYVRIQNLYLPRPFVRENGINKPGEISLLGKDGTKWPTNLLMNMRGTMSFGQGWKDFVKANGVESGFTLKLIWEDTTPVLSLCCAESTNDMEQEEYFKAIKKQSRFIDQSNRDKISKDENTKEERRKNHLSGGDSTPSSQKQFVTLTITPSCFSTSKLRLPKSFTRENDINKPGTITLLGKDGVKYQTSLLFESRNRRMTLGKGWKVFAEANDLKLGDPFTFKLTWERTTPVLSLCPAECSIDKEAGGECLPIDDNNRKDNGKEETRSGREKNHLRGRDPTPSSQKQFVTLTITPTSFAKSRLLLPMQFVRENSINKPGMIYLLGRDGTKWPTNLVQNKKGVMGLGKGCKDFAEANDLKTGESFTMELIWKDGTRMLRLFNTKSSSSKAKEKESVSTEARSRDSLFQTKSSSSKANEKDSVSTEPRSRDSLFHTMSSSSKAKEKELVSTKPRSRDSLFHTESSCSKAKEKESDPTEAKSRESLFHTKSCSSKAKEKESVSTEARSRDSSSEILNRFVILTLTLENVRARILHLPSQFMKANGIKKLGKITILGRNGMEFSAYLLARDGIIALENGWDKF